ncbi:MAG TPA: WecB/TagA/CpsF family glycosyltransferase [Noviherbaspirillum sp.]
MKTPLPQHEKSGVPHDPPAPRDGQTILGAFIDALSWDDALSRISQWAAARQSRYVCICNVHSVVTTTQDAELKSAVDNADMVTPDGAPIAWAMRRLGHPAQQRINGPDLMLKYLEHAERLGQSVFLFGSTEKTLAQLRITLEKRFPQLRIAGICSPPFRTLSTQEDENIVGMLNDSGAHVVFVGLGCPKQEKWMAAHRGRVNAVMIGVGAAFDYHSGTVKRAPLWWQQHGLEWLYRLGCEPRRLLKRYMVTNTLFVLGFARQLIASKLAQRA